ncbi:MAG: hypothetical protein ILP23_00080 [Paludibacteraceae bacterium]|nr:hypothetical protein [Paludibacteraceae bacterium]
METKQIDVKVKKIVYVAYDGTEFDNGDECHKYENTAVGALMTQIKPLAVNSMTEFAFFGTYCGSEEYDYYIVKAVGAAVEPLRRLADLTKRNAGTVERAIENGEHVIICQSQYDRHDVGVLLDTVESFISNLESFKVRKEAE